MHDQSAVTTFLFTDIEGSTRLWELGHERMRTALAQHDAIVQAAVTGNRGLVVKMSGDGLQAVFADPLDALGATLQMQQALADAGATNGIAFKVRCGLHAGVAERRDNDFFGSAVNRAARIMSTAHGGQVLLSQAVAVLLTDRLPAGVALRDLGAVRLRDLASSEHVYQVVHPQLQQDFPALRALESTPNNLPQQVTSFIGREEVFAEVKKVLAKTRLLTLLGVGGIGKTRLSLQVAADVMDQYTDGVWFVGLASLSDARLVPQAVAFVLGVKEVAGRPVVEALVKYVSDRRLLLILDNCEHLVHACAELAMQLLQSGPHLKILAASREHLNIAGEVNYPVPVLRMPDPQQAIPLAALTQYEAVRLFAERAVAAQPSFQVTGDNARAVAEICHRLDGIPLALELAAARVRSLSVEKIAARLGDRFRLLTNGDQTALPRQQTLRALIDWSYDLLTEQERELLRRLAVFAGGFTLEAAEAVAKGADSGEGDVLDLLSHLVEKSLVVLEAEGERYRLLDTVRQYAQDRLDESLEGDRVRTRHLAFYLKLAERAWPELVGPDERGWLARLDLERENLLVAHLWCDRAEGGAQLGLRLIFAVKLYLMNRGLLALGLRLNVEALARAGAQERNLARCRVLFNAGQACSFMGRYQEAAGYLEESLAIARELGENGRVAAALELLGIGALARADIATARGHLEEVHALTQRHGDKRELAAATNALAHLHRLEGALDTAEPLYETVLALARELADREIIAIGLLNLAMVSICRGAGERVPGMLQEVHAIVEEIGSKALGVSLLEVSTGLAALRADWQRAALLFGAAEAQTVHTGFHRDPADEAFLAPMVANAREALGAEAFAAAEAAGRAITYEEAMAGARALLDKGS